MARYRLNNVTFTPGTRQIDTGMTALALKDLTLIVNSTSGVTICNVGMKSTIESITNGIVTYKAQTEIMLPSGVTKTVELAALSEGDELYVEVDFGGLTPIDAVVSEVTAGKTAIVSAINAKGGTATGTQSFTELASAIVAMPNTGISARGITASEPFSFLDFICSGTATYRNALTSINDDVVTSIRSYAFPYCTSLQSVNMSNVTNVNSYGFYNCSSLQSVNMPNVTSIGDYGFCNCSSLQSVDMSNILTLGKYSFSSCSSLQSVIMPNVTSVALNSFTSCSSLQSVNMPNVTSIGTDVFNRCTSLKSVIFGVLTNFNGASVFPYCNKLEKITIGKGTAIYLNFSTWNPTEVADDSLINANFVLGIIDNLYDYSGGTAHSIQLNAALKARLTTETIALANAKGWNIL